MIFDKKRAASMILSKLGKDGKTREMEVTPEHGAYNEYHSIAEDMLQAFKEGSVHRLASTLKAYHSMIEDADEEQDAEG